MRSALSALVLVTILGLGPQCMGQTAHLLAHGIFAEKKAPAPQPASVRATLQPAFTIPVGPLGFAPPGEFYLGARVSQMSLDFLDEDHLLFTFRIPGLIHRDAHEGEDSGKERRIRAVVVKLPQGNIEAETLWTVHDYTRYLYMLDQGKFLLRDRNSLFLSDASLQLKPYLQFPGDVLSVQLDPSQHFLVTNSVESPAKKPAQGEVSSPSTAAAQVDTHDGPAQEKDNLVLRILRRDSGQVMLVSHVRSLVRLPLNDEGYLEPIRSDGSKWLVNLNLFQGGSRVVGNVESACVPTFNFASPKLFLVTGCGSSGDPKVAAMSMNGKRLWENPSIGNSVWPLLVMSSDGRRLARETLMATHAVNAFAALETSDIKGQDVQIIDTATGKVVLRAAANPVLDAGGNVALSPSSRRVAILMEGGIQVFELPAAPPIPDTGADRAGQ